MSAFMWFWAKRHFFDLKVSELKWTSACKVSLFDFEVSLQPFETPVIGRGTDFNKSIALEKAVMESLERSIYHKFFHKYPSTNGMAIHIQKNISVQNANLELIERDVFLRYFFTQKNIPDVSSSLKTSIPNEVEFLKRNGIELKLGEMLVSPTAKVYICTSFGTGSQPEYGSIIGLGAATSKENAIAKAIGECLSKTYAWLDQRHAPLSLYDFEKLDYHSPDDHYFLGLNREPYGNFWLNLFKEGACPIIEPKYDIKTEVINIKSLYDKLPPYYYSIAKSADCFDLKFGPTHLSQSDQSRLDLFTKRDAFNVPDFPHNFA